MSRETIQKVLMIPADPRTGKPGVINAMKAACMGEFSLEVKHTCPECYSGEFGPNDDCEICKGAVTYTQKQDIPWDTMKDIYKMMAGVAAAEITPSIPAPVLTVGFDPGGKGDRAALAVKIGDVLGTFTVEPAKG